MKMTSMDVWTVVVPSRPGRVNSAEWVPEVGWDVVPKHILRINTDTELYGLGETGRGVPIEDVRAGAARVLGRDPETVTLQNLYEPQSDGTETMPEVGTGPAYHALEMAVFDLIGRARGISVHALMGGAVRDRVRADYWMGSQTPEDGKRTVARALEQGFKGIKIKCKIEEPMVERLRGHPGRGGSGFQGHGGPQRAISHGGADDRTRARTGGPRQRGGIRRPDSQVGYRGLRRDLRGHRHPDCDAPWERIGRDPGGEGRRGGLRESGREHDGLREERRRCGGGRTALLARFRSGPGDPGGLLCTRNFCDAELHHGVGHCGKLGAGTQPDPRVEGF